MNEEKCLDSELWHACAGNMVQMPLLNSKVFYFPQGHAEHTLMSNNVEFGTSVPSFMLCRVCSVKYMADKESDEVYAIIRLIPDVNNIRDHDNGNDDYDGILCSRNVKEKPSSFAKTLTQSDANNGGGFSVPRYCAETIFPRLDYTADPPVQNVVAKDVHGDNWKFRHIYRGTPRRHLLTTGWSNFVNHKKLVAGDSIVFLRAENGDLCVGIIRANKGFGVIGGNESSSSGWNTGGSFSRFCENNKKLVMSHGGVSNGEVREKGKVRPESVVEAALLAASGKAFEVVYYPRASTPEFCVKASSVSAAMRIQWLPGMRFKMPFETEDSSRVSWFMGTVASVRVTDPVCWPNSPWRMLRVTWDEPDLLQNVKSVNPWLVEVVSNIPVLNLSPFSPPQKKLRVLDRPEFPFESQFPVPSFSGNPLRPSSPLSYLSDKITADIQGARHSYYSNKPQVKFLPPSFLRLDPRTEVQDNRGRSVSSGNENVSCLLSIGSSCQNLEKNENLKTPRFILFGQPILTEQQLTSERSFEEVSKVTNFASGRNDLPKWLTGAHILFNGSDIGLETGHCKVFLESEDVGRTLDLSVLGSYQELLKRLEHMFGIERLEMLSHVFYSDAAGAVKQIGNEPFREFIKTAKRLTIRTGLSSDISKRKLITGLLTDERGLDSSNRAGSFSIFA